MNYATFRDTTIKLLNYYSTSGNLTPISDGNTQDAVLRFPQFAQSAQLEIATTAKYIHKKKVISQNPVPNLLPNPLYTFDVQAHLGTDLTDMCAIGAKSYNFEVDNIATIYVEEEYPTGVWTILQTLTNTVKGQYTIFKGFTGVTDVTHNVRVRFSGDYPYNIRNKALFAYVWSTVDDMPIYQKFAEYTMPSDFYMLNKVINKGNNMLYQNTVDWNWEGRNTIAVEYFMIGEIDVFYYSYLTTVPSTPTDDWIFDLDEEACQAIPYYVAAQILMDDPVNKSVSDKLLALYQGKLANMNNTISQGSQSVKNSMFVSSDSKLF